MEILNCYQKNSVEMKTTKDCSKQDKDMNILYYNDNLLLSKSLLQVNAGVTLKNGITLTCK